MYATTCRQCQWYFEKIHQATLDDGSVIVVTLRQSVFCVLRSNAAFIKKKLTQKHLLEASHWTCVTGDTHTICQVRPCSLLPM